jgi:hypothetical protein
MCRLLMHLKIQHLQVLVQVLIIGKGDTANKFNLLSRDGRREWREAGGCEGFSGAVKGKEGVEGGI